MQNNLKAELIAKTGLTAVAFLLIGAMAIAQSAPAATSQHNARQKAQKKWLPANAAKLTPDKQEAGGEIIRRTGKHQPQDAQSGQAVGHSAPASAAPSANSHPKPAGQIQGAPIKGPLAYAVH